MDSNTDNTYRHISVRQDTLILVIEDNEINCEILQEMLHDKYTLLFAHNGKEGMDMMRKHFKDIDVVLLDIQMPVMNGYEVLEAKGREEILKDIPVIVTTSSHGGDEEIRCLELGAQDYVRKPYDPVVVRLRIDSIIKLRASTEANRQKALFIQNISHEIRTPMNAIMGFAQILESMTEGTGGEDMQMFCDNIVNNSTTLMSMIDNMVMLSNYDSGTMTMKMTQDSPNRICREAIENAAYSMPKGVRTFFTSDVDDDFTFTTDAKYLRQAIYNLLLNANKFTQEGEIDIHCSLSSHNDGGKGVFVISVTDTGIGIPPEKAEYVFERFNKIDPFIPGLGLGLTIVRKIAECLNGTAYLDTSYTDGSRFVLEIMAD